MGYLTWHWPLVWRIAGYGYGKPLLLVQGSWEGYEAQLDEVVKFAVGVRIFGSAAETVSYSKIKDTIEHLLNEMFHKKAITLKRTLRGLSNRTLTDRPRLGSSLART